MAVTIHDVAKLAGVNSSTVSRVINGKATITPDTKARVFAAMRPVMLKPSAMCFSAEVCLRLNRQRRPAGIR